jgi:hypothetical protein
MLTRTETAKPKVVNGINVDDLFALIEGVKGDSAKGKTHWRVKSAWQGQTRTSTSLARSVARIGSPTRRSISWRRLTPA